MDVHAGHLSVQTFIDLKFADGTYRFALGLAQIHELQTKCGVGIGALYSRVIQGRLEGDVSVGHPAFGAYHIDDLVETVRQGLIGGKEGEVDGQKVEVGALRANELVERYLTPMPLVEQWNLAAAILYALVEGYTPDDKKKAGRPPKASAKSKGGSTIPVH